VDGASLEVDETGVDAEAAPAEVVEATDLYEPACDTDCTPDACADLAPLPRTAEPGAAVAAASSITSDSMGSSGTVGPEYASGLDFEQPMVVVEAEDRWRMVGAE